MWLTDRRIDYVFARAGDPDHPVAVERAFLAGEQSDHPSDRFAVVTDLHG